MTLLPLIPPCPWLAGPWEQPPPFSGLPALPPPLVAGVFREPEVFRLGPHPFLGAGWPLCWDLWGLEVLLLVCCCCAGEQRALSGWGTVGTVMLILPAEGFGKMKFSSALPAACDGDSVVWWCEVRKQGVRLGYGAVLVCVKTGREARWR